MNAIFPFAAVLVGAAALLTPSTQPAAAQSKPAAPPPLRRSIVHVCLVPRSFDEYVRDSEDVITGQVVAQRQVVPATGVAYREIDIDVLSSVKGTAPSKLTVDVIGVKTDTVEVIVRDAPQFQLGETVGLFLMHDARTDHWEILGLSEGTARAHVDATGMTRLNGHLVADETSDSFFDHVLNRWAAQPR